MRIQKGFVPRQHDTHWPQGVSVDINGDAVQCGIIGMTVQQAMVSKLVWLNDGVRDRSRCHLLWQLPEESKELNKGVDIVSTRRPHKIVADMLWQGEQLPLQSTRQLARHAVHPLTHAGGDFHGYAPPLEAVGDGAQRFLIIQKIMLRHIHQRRGISDCGTCSSIVSIISASFYIRFSFRCDCLCVDTLQLDW